MPRRHLKLGYGDVNDGGVEDRHHRSESYRGEHPPRIGGVAGTELRGAGDKPFARHDDILEQGVSLLSGEHLHQRLLGRPLLSVCLSVYGIRV